ncbi:MAG: DegT/DnrJ/EryC1/StrS family aminotransferase [Phycisphaerae bacterium]
MNVPALDLKAQYAPLKDEVMPIVEQIFDSQYFVGGPAVAELESAIAEYSGTAGAVGVSSGTDALLVSLMVLGIGQDHPACRTGQTCTGCDEVITTTFSFFATPGSIWRAGARPVFVDIDETTFNIDPAQIEAAITENTRAIMPVHLYGQLADMDAINAIAEKHDLQVIEDAAQSIGARQNGKRAGSFGTTGCLSFYPSKNLGGAGDGGMVTAGDEEILEKLAWYRNHGMNPKYYHKYVGGNFRLDTIQAAFLLVKLQRLEDWHAARRRVAARYDQLLADCPGVKTPVIAEGNESVFNQYVIRVAQRDALMEHLRANGVGCDIYYPLCLHEQECFADLGYQRGQFPVAEAVARDIIALPIYPELTDEQIDYVAATVKSFVS